MNERFGPSEIGELLQRHGARLVLYARHLCDEPEDVVQAAFIKLAEQPSTPDSPIAWLFRVVRNSAISSRRASARRRRHEADATQQKQAWFLPSADEAIDGRAVAEALESMSVEQREIITARIWGELTFAQIGNLIGISDTTAHRRYQEALAELRRRMGETCMTNG